MRIQDFTSAVDRRRDTAAVEVRGDSVCISRGLPLFGRLFRPGRAAERNRHAVDAFVDAVDREWGRNYSEVVRSLLAQPRLDGRPLRKYMIADALNAVHNEQRRIAAYNEHVGDMDTLLKGLADQAPDLPRGLLGHAATEIHDALRREWPSTREPVPAFLLRELTEHALLAAANTEVAERLLAGLDDSAGSLRADAEAAALRRTLDELVRDWALSGPGGRDLRRFVSMTLGRYAALRPGPVRAADLLDAVARRRLPGLEALLSLLSPAPLAAPDPRFRWYDVPPLRAAWLVAALPEDGLPLTLALQHAETIFISIPPGTPPLPSEIWRSVFDEEPAPDLDARPECLHGRMEERLRRYFTDPGDDRAGRAAWTEVPDLRNIDRLYRLGLHPESVERLFGPPGVYPALSSADFVELPAPPVGPVAAPPPDHAMVPERAAGVAGRGAVIVFHDAADADAPPLDRAGALRRMEAWRKEHPARHDSLACLMGPLGAGPLRDLGAALGMEFPAWLPCAAAIRPEGDTLVVTRDFDVVVESGRSGIRAGLRYRIRPDGSARTEDVFFIKSVLPDPPAAVRDAYLRGSLLTGSPGDAVFRGGLPGAVDGLLEGCGLGPEHAERVEGFVARALRHRFDDPTPAPKGDFGGVSSADLPETMARLNELVGKRRLAGLSELLYALGAPLERVRPRGDVSGISPAFDLLFEAYRPEPEAAAWMVRMTGGGVPAALGFQHLEGIARVGGPVSGFSAAAYWESVFGEPLPADVTKPFPDRVRNRLDTLFHAELLAAFPERGLLDPGFQREAMTLLDELVLAGVHVDVVMGLAREHRALRASDFAALPVLRPPAGPEAEQRCIRELAATPAFGDATPLIRFPDVPAGGPSESVRRRAAWSETVEDGSTGMALPPAVRAVIRHARDVCGDSVPQLLGLYQALSEPGNGLYRLLLRAAAGVSPVVPPAASMLAETTVRRRDDGTISVEQATPRDEPLAVRVRWGIAPDGFARCEDAFAAPRREAAPASRAARST